MKTQNLNSKNTRRFLALIKAAVTGSSIEGTLFEGITNSEWNEIFELSLSQSAVAFAFDGIELLPKKYHPEMEILMDWLGQKSHIEEIYRQNKSLSEELATTWKNAGINTLVFKGLAHSRYYLKPEHREFCDFDCYLFHNDGTIAYDEGNKIAIDAGGTVDDSWYKHSKIKYKSLLVENHRFFTTTRKGTIEQKLNAYLKNVISDGVYLEKFEDSYLLLPPLEFEGLFMVYHSLMHFLVEGVSIKHFTDWTCWMQKNQNHIIWSSFYNECKRYKLDRFVDVLNNIAERYFNLNLDHNLNQSGNQKPFETCRNQYIDTLADRVLCHTLFDDSKIYEKEKGAWFERIGIIRNAFRYSWKYREVAGYSMPEYIWNYVWGFITRREKEA